MELKVYWHILKKRGLIILLTALITGVAAYGFSYFQEPIYRAQILVSVRPARADFGLTSSTKDLLRNFQTNLMTHTMAQKVIDRAQLDMNTYELLSEVEVNPQPDRFVMEIVAKDPDPQTAVTIVQTMAQIFVDEQEAWNQQQDKRDRIDVWIVDDARDAPLWRPNPKLNAVAGFILGAFLGAIIVFALEWAESAYIRTSDDMERAAGVRVLGAIPGDKSSKNKAKAAS
jgi:capsular polysaccharide biosynthesis protein